MELRDEAVEAVETVEEAPIDPTEPMEAAEEVEDSREASEELGTDDTGERLVSDPEGLVLSLRRGGLWMKRDLTVNWEADFEDPSERMESLGRVEDEAKLEDSCLPVGFKLMLVMRLPN